MRFEEEKAIPSFDQKQREREEIERQTAEFLAKGGKIVTHKNEGPVDDWMSERDAALYLGIHPTKLRTARSLGSIYGCPAPAYSYMGERAVFSKARLDEWKRIHGHVIWELKKNERA